MLELIKKASNGDEESLVRLLDKFDPLISKYSYQLPYEEAKTDLIIFFIEMIRNFKVKNIDHNGQAVNYISKAIYHKKIDLYRKYLKNTKEEISINFNILANKDNYEKDTIIFIKTILKSLVITDLQRKILKKNLLKVIQTKKLEEC